VAGDEDLHASGHDLTRWLRFLSRPHTLGGCLSRQDDTECHQVLGV
jgi:hypothetical protein